MKPYLIIAAALPLSACISFGAKPPPSLLNLTSAASLAASEARSVNPSETIAISIPITPQAIATTRVVVSDGATSIAYVQKAVWVEPPARLFQRLLSETIAAKTGKAVIDQRQIALEPGSLLSGQLLRFGIDATSSEAVIVYDATLSRSKTKQILARRFETRVRVSVIEATAAGVALNRAANQIAGDVATWVGETP